MNPRGRWGWEDWKSCHPRISLVLQSRGWSNQRVNRTLSFSVSLGCHYRVSTPSLIKSFVLYNQLPVLDQCYHQRVRPHCNHHNPKYLANFARDQYRKSVSVLCSSFLPSITFFPLGKFSKFRLFIFVRSFSRSRTKMSVVLFSFSKSANRPITCRFTINADTDSFNCQSQFMTNLSWDANLKINKKVY